MYRIVCCTIATLAALCLATGPAAAQDAAFYFSRGLAHQGQVRSKYVSYQSNLASLDRAIAELHGKIASYDSAIADYDQALKLRPGDRAYLTQRQEAFRQREDWKGMLATAETERRNFATPAMPSLGRPAATAQPAVPPQPAAPKPDAAAAAAAADAAACARAAGDEAIAACTRVLARDPGNALAYNSRATAYSVRGDHSRAIADFDQALKLNPANAAAYAGRGRALDAKGEHGRAIGDFDQALMFDPGNAAVRQSRERAQAALAPRPGDTAKQPEPAGPQATPSAPAAPPQQRVALVIGNAAYRGQPVLTNPKRDATAVAEALRQAGFQSVELALDVDRAGMVAALRAFRGQADKADWALVYFAGHGIELDGANYLVPVDAKLEDDRDVKDEAVSYDRLLDATGSARTLKMLILDACRDNPFKARMRSTGRGLAPPPEPDAGMLIAFSAAAGQRAADDIDGANSPFARAFIAQIKKPGVEVRRLFEYVRDDVLAATGRRQRPFTSQSLPSQGEFYFTAGR
jgi:tetratricopeptide (TPR) repeat protein